MTLLLNLDESPVSFDRLAGLDALNDVIVIVRGPYLPEPREPQAATPSWLFDDNHLVTWEDAEWQ